MKNVNDEFKHLSTGDHAFHGEAPSGAVREATFAGATSFMRRRYSKSLDDVDLAVVGVPYDLATSHRPGARFGPRAVREASSQMAWNRLWPLSFDPFERLNVVDCGDVSFDYGRPEAIPAQIERSLATIIGAGVVPLTIGGDHFISYPILKAMHAHHGTLSLIHFDAHCDTWEDEDGRIDHGTMFYHAAKQALVDPARSVQLGMRTVNDNNPGFNVFDALWMHRQGVENTLQAIRETVGDNPCYVTFDIDFLDPGFAPGTGTPVCGGFSTLTAIELLTGLAGINVVGADVVEVAPAYDHAAVTALAGATIAAHLVGLVAQRPQATQ